MSKIEYKEELFNIVKDLSLINNSIIFIKSEDKSKVLVKRRDIEQSIAYILEVPVSYFNFETEDVSFYNYNEFYQYINAFDNPEIKMDNNKIYIYENNSKVNYILSDKESLAKEGILNNIKFENSVVKFNLSSSELDEIVKMSSLIRAKKAKIIVEGNTITVRVYSNQHENSFEKIFTKAELLDKNNNPIVFSESIEFIIFSDIFNKIPQKKNYTVEIKKEGFIKIKLVDENINLSVYTGGVRD